jgi:hypothetical protein
MIFAGNSSLPRSDPSRGKMTAAARSVKFFMRLLVRGILCKCVSRALLNHRASGQLYFWEMLAYPPHDCFVQIGTMQARTGWRGQRDTGRVKRRRPGASPPRSSRTATSAIRTR